MRGWVAARDYDMQMRPIGVHLAAGETETQNLKW